MERLTERVFAFNGTSCMQIKACGNDTCDETCRNITGEKGCEDCPIQIAIDKLAEYEDLEEQGKLLKLPCAVGDTVYSFSFGKILTLCVDSFVIYTDGIDARLSSKMKEYEFLKIDMDIADFGEKWFSTKEAAEAELKELERGKGE